MVNIKKNFIFLVLLIFLSGCNELKDFNEKKISSLIMREEARFHYGEKTHSGYYSRHLAQASNELRIFRNDPEKRELIRIVEKAKHAISLLKGVPSNLGDAIEVYNGFKDNKNDPEKFLRTLKEFDISEKLVLEDEENPSSNLVLYDDEVNGTNRVIKELKSLILLIRSNRDFLPETSLLFDFVVRNLSYMSLLKLEWAFSKCWNNEDEGSQSRLDEITDLYESAIEQVDTIEDQEKKEAFIEVINSSKQWIDLIFESKDTANKLFSSSGKAITDTITTIERLREWIEENPESKDSLSNVLDYLDDAHKKLSSFLDFIAINER